MNLLFINLLPIAYKHRRALKTIVAFPPSSGTSYFMLLICRIQVYFTAILQFFKDYIELYV